MKGSIDTLKRPAELERILLSVPSRAVFMPIVLNLPFAYAALQFGLRKRQVLSKRAFCRPSDMITSPAVSQKQVGSFSARRLSM